MKKLLFLIYCITLGSLLHGQKETRSSRAYANDLVITSSFIQAEDDKFTGSGSWISGFRLYENKAMVELGLDEDKHLKHASAFKICATFYVDLIDSNLSVTTYTNVQLDINYNPLEQTRYKDKARIVYPNKYKIKVYNVSIKTCSVSSTCGSCTTPYTLPDVYLQAEISTNRIYDFGFSSTLSSGELTDSLTATQQLKVSWAYVSGANEYELEYTYVDDYDKSSLSTFIPSSALTYDLEHDATRIITNFNHYYIPLTYEHGYIVYRLRPIGSNTHFDRIEGAWFGSAVTGTVSSAAKAVALTSPFGSNLKNWEGVKTFAEQGKTGVGVNFNDGLGFKRQSLARLNTDGKTIVQSTLYDYFGRPVINLLPSPVSGLNLDYRLNLNRILSGTTSVTFDKSVFDNYVANTSVCSTLSFTLDPANSVGAGNYYSPSNSNKQAFQGYVPDAEGIPYTQVKYKADALGRVTRQTLPGGLHIIGSTKDIKYYYAQPTQVELDRLFGSEAGRAKYHFKDITIDPNGQTSVNYKDRFGRTVATSLLGLNPLNVDILANNVTTTPLIEYLHLTPTNDEDPVNRCKEVNATFFVSSPSTEGYVYYTTLGSFASTCNISTCYDCVYDVEISITDDCGNPIINPPYSQSIGKQPPYTVGSCSASPTSTYILGTTLTTPITFTFPVTGVYTVRKKICVSEAPVDDYTNNFILNGCNDKKCTLLDSILNASDFTGCGTPSNCAQCIASVSAAAVPSSTIEPGPGDPPGSFNNPVYTASMTPQQYSQALQNCEMYCPPKGQCAKYTKLLLADFYAGTGQYAQTTNANATLWGYSIFNNTNSLTVSAPPTFSTPPVTYSNAAGVADCVQLSTGTVVPSALTAANYEYYYKRSWAKSFLDIHPERCKLFFYCNIIGASKDYDDAMNYITHSDTAWSSGYWKPILAAYSSYSAQSIASTTANYDPVLSLASSYGSFSTAINNFKAEITQNYSGSGKDLYQFVVMQSIPGASVNSPPTSDYAGKDACYADLDWIRFRNLYQVKKFALYQNLYAIYSASTSVFGYSGPICGYAPAGFTSHFPNWMDSLSTAFSATPSTASSVTLALNTPTNLSTNTATANAYISSMNTFSNNLVANMNSTLTGACATSCNTYTNNWYNILNTACPAFSGTTTPVKNQIIAGLVGVCMKGCDYTTNLLGASTASPGTNFTLAATSVTVNSFQQVLNYYLGTNACNAVVLSQPAPYPTSTVQNMASITSCKCDQLLQTETDFLAMQTASTLPAGIGAAWQLFRKQNGYDLHDYNLLKCMCKTATSNTWSPGHTWVSSELAALAQNTFAIDPRLTCTSCLSCTNVVNAINSLTLPIVGSYTNVIDAITQDSTNQIFAVASLNNMFGPRPFQDYLDLYADCKTFTTSSAYTFSNTITPEAIDLFRYLNELVQGHQLNNGPRPAKICTDSKYFLSSLYTGALPSIPSYTYSIATPFSNVLTFSISNTPTTALAVVSLTAPASYTGTWSNLLYLNNFNAYCPTPTAGANYKFKVNAIDAAYSVLTLTGSVVNSAWVICNLSSGAYPVPTLCPHKTVKKNACTVNLINSALTQAAQLAAQALSSAIGTFQNNYRDACYTAINETFTRKYNGADDYNFTLYYYDEGGNLQRTVAPNGADPGVLTTVTVPISPSTTIYPTYSSSTAVNTNYVSDYRYHSYNIPLQENTIDGGQTVYIYDVVGRLVASQNAKQAAASTSTNNLYSYTLYDDLGRISQVGQAAFTSTLASPQTYNTYTTTLAAISGTLRTQVTSTYYDVSVTTASVLTAITGSVQTNLRNRVAYVTYKEIYSANTYSYNHATYYSYDQHGNVKELVQHTRDLDVFAQGFRKVRYEYELVSGNMILARFQPNMPDQFFHRYYYDADNRLQEVFTSKDSLLWDRDAKYLYYEHGPLARIERADKKVQGSDYFYTIHGWIKGINGDALNPIGDPGKDATTGSAYLSSYSNIHQYFANDAAAFDLNYYNSGSSKDYKAIKTFTTTDISPNMSLANLYSSSAPFYLDNLGAGDGASLYNGNISSMVTSIIDKDLFNNIPNNTAFPLIAGYRYDQLHRITKMKTFRMFSSNAWTTPTTGNYDDAYKMAFTYDNNGNIKTLLRSGPGGTLYPGSSLSMDNLSYTYYKTVANGGITTNYNSNKLACLTDAVSSGNYGVDVDTYASCSELAPRYRYDEVGNLILDKGEYIASIEWTVDRKVKKITRDPAALASASVTLSDIEYEYNGQRQRVVKIVKPRDVATKTLTPITNWLFTYYVYDASGNVQALYDRSVTPIGGSNYKDILSLAELDIYGSARLALSRPTNTLASWLYTFSLTTPNCGGVGSFSDCRTVLGPPSDTFTLPANAYIVDRQPGFKEFELTNHLGNVITTVSDRKVQATFDATTCATYYDFSGSVPATIFPQNMTLAISGGSLLATEQSGMGISGMDCRMGTNVNAAITYQIEYDFNPGNLTLTDGFYIIPYDYNGSFYMGPYYCDGTFVPPAGHYSFTYTPSGAAPTVYTYLAFNTGSSTTHTFTIDNLSMCPVNAPAAVSSYSPDILKQTDYYAFGQEMPARNWTASDYRYGMNGQEKDNEIFNGAMGAEYWEYDSRIGRRWNVDPVTYPWQSPYACFNNNPIYFSDPTGAVSGTNNPGGGAKTDPQFPLNKGGNAIPLEEVVVTPSLPAASTGNGPANGQPVPSTPANPSSSPGNYHTGVWEISYNPNLRAAGNFNTANQSMPRYLGEPSPAQYMQQAQNLAYSGGVSAGYGGFAVNSEGDISVGYKNPNVTVNGGSVKGIGAGGVMVSSNGISAGPINATNETSGYTPGPYIVHDQTGKITGTVQASFIIKTVQASVFVGGYKSSVTAVRSFSSTDGSVGTQTLGTTVNKGFSISGGVGGFNAGLDFNVK